MPRPAASDEVRIDERVRVRGIWVILRRASAAGPGRRHRRGGRSAAAGRRSRRPPSGAGCALTRHGYLKPEWSDRRLSQRRRSSGTSRPRPGQRPRRLRRGLRAPLRPAPRPLSPTTACRWACGAAIEPDGTKTGIQIDCMVCHGGSIGGKSYVGLGNTQLDLEPALQGADQRRRPARRRSSRSPSTRPAGPSTPA